MRAPSVFRTVLGFTVALMANIGHGSEAQVKVSVDVREEKSCVVIAAEIDGTPLGLKLEAYDYENRREFQFLNEEEGIVRLTSPKMNFRVTADATTQEPVVKCFEVGEINDLPEVVVNNKTQGSIMALRGKMFHYFPNNIIRL